LEATVQGGHGRELAHYRIIDFGIQAPFEWRRLPSHDPLDPLTLLTPHGGLFRATSIPERRDVPALETLLDNVDGEIVSKHSFEHPSGAASAEAVTRDGDLVRRSVLVSGPGAEAVLSLIARPRHVVTLAHDFDAIVASVFFGARLDPSFPERTLRAFVQRWPRLTFRLRRADLIEAVDPDGRAWQFGLAGLARKIVADPSREEELIHDHARGLGNDVRILPRERAVVRMS
jgi:hypothetical protein